MSATSALQCSFKETTYEFFSEEELVHSTGNCKYCRRVVKCTPNHMRSRHISNALIYECSGQTAFTIPCFCEHFCRESQRCHWHCPKCQKVISRIVNFQTHLSKHGLKVTGKQKDGLEVPGKQKDDASCHQAQVVGGQGGVECHECRSTFSNVSYLKRHQRTYHGKEHPPNLCVDQKIGIFVTPKDLSGPSFPIHIGKSVVLQRLACESATCRIAAESGNPGAECQESVSYSAPPTMTAASTSKITESAYDCSRTTAMDLYADTADMADMAAMSALQCSFKGTTYEFFSEEELMHLDGNCKYCRRVVKCTPDHMRSRHISNALFYECSGRTAFTIPCFCEHFCRESQRCHWHCPKCQKVISRIVNFQAHLSKHGLKVLDKQKYEYYLPDTALLSSGMTTPVKGLSSSLHMWVPPLRLLSASIWQVAQQCHVRYYTRVEEFVSLVLELFPDLLSTQEKTELLLGLRSKFVLDLCHDQPSITLQMMQPHLDRVSRIAECASSDVTVQIAVRNFMGLIHALLTNHAYRKHFFQEIYSLRYGLRYDTALQSLVWEFLSRLEKLLPVPSFHQAATWFDGQPMLLEECLQMLYDLQPIQNFMVQCKHFAHAPRGSSSPPIMSNIILSTLSDCSTAQAVLSACGQAETCVSAPHEPQHCQADSDTYEGLNEDSCSGDVDGGVIQRHLDEGQSHASIDVEMTNELNGSSSPPIMSNIILSTLSDYRTAQAVLSACGQAEKCVSAPHEPQHSQEESDTYEDLNEDDCSGDVDGGDLQRHLDEGQSHASEHDPQIDLQQSSQKIMNQQEVKTTFGTTYEFFSEEELVHSTGTCKYCRRVVKCTPDHMRRHISNALFYECSGQTAFTIPCLCKHFCRESQRCHWHCPKCQKVISRSVNFQAHLSKHGLKVTGKKKDDTSCYQAQLVGGQGGVECHECGSTFLNVSTLKRHQRTYHGKPAVRGVCVKPESSSPPIMSNIILSTLSDCSTAQAVLGACGQAETCVSAPHEPQHSQEESDTYEDLNEDDCSGDVDRGDLQRHLDEGQSHASEHDPQIDLQQSRQRTMNQQEVKTTFGTTYEFFSEEELLHSTGNCKYCRRVVKCTPDHMRRHISNALFYECSGQTAFTIPCLCKHFCRESQRCHWHCPKCQKVISRSVNFQTHLSKHGLKVTGKKKDDASCHQAQLVGGQGGVECHECQSTFSNVSTLKRHQRTYHGKHGVRAVCVKPVLSACGQAEKCVSAPHEPQHSKEVTYEDLNEHDCSGDVDGGDPQRDSDEGQSHASEHDPQIDLQQSSQRTIQQEVKTTSGTTYEFFSEEELVHLTGNCKYCRRVVNCTPDHMRRHISNALFYECSGRTAFTIPCLCKHFCRGAKRCHWHCPKCQKVISRSVNFQTHLSKHGVKLLGKVAVRSGKPYGGRRYECSVFA
ncbi:hypothetical protein ACEWY4_010819 [Coilia grayii]|uniref:C2H2-type domain-containing protein n=1 Tax=Coilia grayii TaxID=363190 RepID=A0ABD1K314_9TELE